VEAKTNAEQAKALAMPGGTTWRPYAYRLGLLWDIVDSLVDECAKHESHIAEILLRAFKYDDKPHQLYSGIAEMARAYPNEDTAAIVALMDVAYGASNVRP
jgi:hypothetical protein